MKQDFAKNKFNIDGKEFAFMDTFNSKLNIFTAVAEDRKIRLPNTPLFKEKKEDKKQKDLAYGSCILVSEGENANGGYFLRNELLKAYKTPILKPVNIEHNQDIIVGVIYNSSVMTQSGLQLSDEQIKCLPDEEEEDMRNRHLFMMDEGGNFIEDKVDIKTDFVIYKNLFPDVAEEIASHQNNGINSKYFVSMEVFYNEFGYVFNHDEASLVAVSNDMLGSKIWDKYEPWVNQKMPDGRHVSKAYLNYTFGGVGITQMPANKRSYLLTLASQDKDKFENDAINVVNSFEGMELHTNAKLDNDAEEVMLTKEQREGLDTEVNRVMASSPNLDEGAARVRVLEERIANLETEKRDLATAVETAADQIAALQEKENSASKELTEKSQKAELEIAERDVKISDLEKTLAAIQGELTTLKSEKIGMARMAELESLGFNFGERREKIFSRVSAMSDEDFASYKEDMESVLSSKKVEDTKVEVKEEAKAEDAIEPPNLEVSQDIKTEFEVATASTTTSDDIKLVDGEFLQQVFAGVTTRSKDNKRGDNLAF